MSAMHFQPAKHELPFTNIMNDFTENGLHPAHTMFTCPFFFSSVQVCLNSCHYLDP